MRQYLETVGLGDGPSACKLVVTFFRGVALTWWRAYSDDHPNVFDTLTTDVLFDELAENFCDLDRELKLCDQLLGLR